MVRDDSVPKMPAARVEYKRIDICDYNDELSITSVIYDAYADGRETFSESSFGEVRWYNFTPTSFERNKAREFLNNGVQDGVVDMREALD